MALNIYAIGNLNLSYPISLLSGVLISTCVYFVHLDLSSLRFYCTIPALKSQEKFFRQLAQKFWESMEAAPYRDFAGNIWQSPSEKKKSARGAHARAAQTTR